MEHQARAAMATAEAPSRPNGLRPLNHLVVSHEGRKPLFAAGNSARDKDSSINGAAQASPRLKPGRLALEAGNRAASGPGLGLARRTKSESQTAQSQPKRNGNGHANTNDSDNHSNGSGKGVCQTSPGGTRIPRPSSSASSSAFSRRRPISLVEAFKLAEEEEAEAKRAQALDGSPSPAPRSWRVRGARDEVKMRQMLGQDHLDTKVRTAQAPDESSKGSPSKSTAQSAATAPGQEGEKAIVPRNHLRSWEPSPRVSPSRRGNQTSPPLEHHHGSDGHDIPDLVPGIEDIPLPSVEGADQQSRSPRRNTVFPSPEKSFAWQVEADFTAGDLQVSDSPRIRVESNRPFANRPSLVSGDDKISIRSPPRLTHPGSSNTKLDEIRARELKPTNQILAEKSQIRQGNTKLDEIRDREKAVEALIPIPDRHQPRPKNTKLDEIRQREAEGLTKRAYAVARLEEIREQNSTSRSVSPEEARPRSGKQGQQQHDQRKATPGSGQEKKLPTRDKAAPENGGERIPDTPITVFKNRRTTERGANGGDAQEDAADKGPDSKRDSHDLLRRLARATSASPASEPDASSKRAHDEPRPKPSALSRPLDKGRRPSVTAAGLKDREGPKPTVGFTGLRRTESLDLAKGKRSSVQSEADPTDRIEAEILLFAPHDNQSERGSVRAPSPQPSSDDEELAEATPRADKHDFASMPTPKVTGAFVETPATVKVERTGDQRQPGTRATEEAAAVLGDERRGLGWRKGDQDTASDPGTSDYNRDGDAVAAAAVLRRRRRARSLPRRRPPLRNSAKLPSVKGDLLELQRIHKIDDSTMDDLEEILLGRRRAGKLERLRDDQDDDDDDLTSSNDEQPLIKRESSSEADSSEPKANGKYRAKDHSLMDRMSRSLSAGLWNIRTAKQGIARLEDRFSHAGARLEPASDDDTKAPLSVEPKVDMDMDEIPDQHKKPKIGTDMDEKKEPKVDMDMDEIPDQHKKPKIGTDMDEKKEPKVGTDMDEIPSQHKEHCAACLARASPGAMTYIHLPVPRLYYTTPRFRLSALGLVLALAALWLALESAMCARYCRPATCSTGECVFSFDDPTTFGAALPVKLDQWTTGGLGRELLGQAADSALDLVADLEDLALGRSIADMPVRGMSFAQKRQHRRRLAKRGLPLVSTSAAAAPLPPPPPPEQRAKWEAWRRARLARDRAREVRDMGYRDDGGDEGAAIGGDRRVG